MAVHEQYLVQRVHVCAAYGVISQATHPRERESTYLPLLNLEPSTPSAELGSLIVKYYT